MGYGYITCQEKTFSLSSECLTFPGPVEAQRPAFTNKAPTGMMPVGASLLKVAATYSPTGVQYHRRKRA